MRRSDLEAAQEELRAAQARPRCVLLRRLIASYCAHCVIAPVAAQEELRAAQAPPSLRLIAFYCVLSRLIARMRRLWGGAGGGRRGVASGGLGGRWEQHGSGAALNLLRIKAQ